MVSTSLNKWTLCLGDLDRDARWCPADAYVFLEHAREALTTVSSGIARARQAAQGEIANVSVGFVPDRDRHPGSPDCWWLTSKNRKATSSHGCESEALHFTAIGSLQAARASSA